MTTKHSQWTDERVEILRKLWDDPDHTGGSIGKILGVSRDAVLGKVYRLNLPKKNHAVKAFVKRSYAPIESTPVDVEPVYVHLLHLKSNQCTAIIGEPSDGLCCGRPIARGSMCEKHAEVYYREWVKSF